MYTVLLIVAVLVLTYMVYSKRETPAKPTQTIVVEKPVYVTTPAAPAVQAKPAEGFKSYEQMAEMALREQNEYFAVCPTQTDEPSGPQCSAGNKYAKEEYGGAADYKDYVAKQGIDERVAANHDQWVKERKNMGPTGEFTTGRTYSPDSHDSYDPVPWQGIRGRPRAVPQCNPTQVPDLDPKLFKGENPYRFFK